MKIDFNFGVRIISGKGCLLQNGELLGQLGKRALIVTGRNGARLSGALADIDSVLDAQGVYHVQFDGVGENPTLDMCAAIVAAARREKPDFFVAIGGGSVMDAAKAGAVIYKNNLAEVDDVYTTYCPEMLPLVCVGTTAGTGSEADGSSVITDRAGRKHSIPGTPRRFPLYSFCDPCYTFSMSERQTVSTALDAFCHSVESYFKTNATDVSRMFAVQGIKILWPELCALSRDEFVPDNYEMREALLYGSVIAGMAIEVNGTAYPHPAGYSLSEKAGIPHGVACALFECDYIKRCTDENPDCARQLAEIAASPDEVCAVLSVLAANDLRLSAEMCEGIAQRISESKNFAFSPVPHTAETAREIAFAFCDANLQATYAGGWNFGE